MQIHLESLYLFTFNPLKNLDFAKWEDLDDLAFFCYRVFAEGSQRNKLPNRHRSVAAPNGLPASLELKYGKP